MTTPAYYGNVIALAGTQRNATQRADSVLTPKNCDGVNQHQAPKISSCLRKAFDEQVFALF